MGPENIRQKFLPMILLEIKFLILFPKSIFNITTEKKTNKNKYINAVYFSLIKKYIVKDIIKVINKTT